MGLKINDPTLKDVLNDDSLRLTVLSSIVGKYVYFEVPCGEEVAAEELETENGGTYYFKSEEEALEFVERIKNS